MWFNYISNCARCDRTVVPFFLIYKKNNHPKSNSSKTQGTPTLELPTIPVFFPALLQLLRTRLNINEWRFFRFSIYLFFHEWSGFFAYLLASLACNWEGTVLFLYKLCRIIGFGSNGERCLIGFGAMEALWVRGMSELIVIATSVGE